MSIAVLPFVRRHFSGLPIENVKGFSRRPAALHAVKAIRNAKGSLTKVSNFNGITPKT